MDLKEAREYVIAVKREFRDHPAIDFNEIVSATPGTRLLGSTATRAQVEATSTGIESLSAKLGDRVFIEQTVGRWPIKAV